MSQTTVNLGMLPQNRGQFTTATWPQNISIYKDNIVQYNGSSYIYNPGSFDIEHPEASATSLRPYSSTPATLNTGWAVFASGNNTFTSGQSVDQVGIDNQLTPSSNNLAKSGVVFDKFIESGVFDLSAYNAVGGELATYADLGAALTAMNSLQAAYKKGGMSIKFVQTSDNKYVQYRLMSDTFNTTPANWQSMNVDDEPTAGSNNLVKSGGVDTELKKKANTDGYYETMGVGTADNLAGQSERTDDAMYRKTGGSEEVASGTATISNIKGQTVAWNQQSAVNSRNIVIPKGSTYPNTTPFTYISSIIPSKMKGHTFFIKCKSNENLKNYYFSSSLSQHKLGNNSFITNATNYSNLYDTLRFSIETALEEPIEDIITIISIDLTLIYGAGNEPSTPEQFEADYEKWFGKPLTYEPVDAGSLRSVQLDLLKTTGFNQYNNGQARVIGGLQYQITGTYTTITLNDEDITPDANGLFTPSTTGTLIITGGGNDTCVHISGDRNGEYEPYEEHSVSLPVTTMTGKLNGTGESVVVFPDGMKSAGTVYDEIYTVGDKTYAVKRIGSVDLGNVNWSYSSIYSFYGGFLSAKTSGALDIPNFLCVKYNAISWSSIYNKTKVGIGLYPTDSYLCVYDSSFTQDAAGAAAFKTAMNGVMLYYELATPKVYELDTFDLPKHYQVDGDGTEEQIQKSGVQGLAAILTCIYGVDAVKILDKLPQNYISEKSMDNFLAQLNTVTGGVWTKTWNENTGEWDFSFTPNAQTNDTNIEETI